MGDEPSQNEAGTGKETEELVGGVDVKEEAPADVPPAEDSKDEVAEDKSQEPEKPDEAKDNPEPQD